MPSATQIGLIRTEVFEQQADIRQLVGDELKRVDDGLRVISVSEGPGAEDQASRWQAELAPQLLATDGRRGELLQVDPPVEQDRSLGRGAEFDEPVQEMGRIGHDHPGEMRDEPVSDSFNTICPVHVGAPGHSHHRNGAVDEVSKRVCEPICVDHVRLYSAHQLPQPACGGPTWNGHLYPLLSECVSGGYPPIIASENDVESTLPGPERQRFGMRRVNRAQHQEGGPA